MTTIYLIRHSLSTDKVLFGSFMTPLNRNMKRPLSEEGIKIAQEKLNNEEFDNIDFIYSSEYKRAGDTAKILADRIHKEIIVDDRFNERIHGITKSYDELPKNFEELQLNDPYYRFNKGETAQEVGDRMNSAIIDILYHQKDKKIAIFTHSTATLFLLKKLTDVTTNGMCSFKGTQYFDNNWSPVETFKLTFEDIELKNIERL